MKKKNRTISLFQIILIIVIILFTPPVGYLTEKQGLAGEVKQSAQSKEILMARNVDLASPIWCG